MSTKRSHHYLLCSYHITTKTKLKNKQILFWKDWKNNNTILRYHSKKSFLPTAEYISW